jgi:hypothetical protein
VRLWGACARARGAALGRSCLGAVCPGAPSGSARSLWAQGEGAQRGARGGGAPQAGFRRRCRRRGCVRECGRGAARGRSAWGSVRPGALSESARAPWAQGEGAQRGARGGGGPRHENGRRCCRQGARACGRRAARGRSCLGAMRPGAPSGSACSPWSRHEGAQRGARGGRAPQRGIRRRHGRRGARARTGVRALAVQWVRMRRQCV